MSSLKRFLLPVMVIVLGIVVYIAIHTVSGENKKYTFSTSSQSVVKQIRSLNRLETAQFTIEKVIDAGTNTGRFQQLLFGDRLLLIAHGEVIAGFDLASLPDDAVQIDGSTLHVTLPAPQILLTKLDPDETRVYDRQTGLLSKGDKDLETNARSEAEKVIRAAACKGGILNEADKNARNQLTALFKSLTFTTVVFTIPQGSC